MSVTKKDKKQAVEVISVSIPSAPRFLRIVRCMVTEIAELKGFARRDRDKICLAVGEACSNVIRHSYKGNSTGQIIIKCKLQSDRLTISIRDFGEKIDLSRVRLPYSEGMKPGGLGIHIIRCSMDNVEYDTAHEVGTEIHMTKYLHPQEDDNGS